MLTSFDNNLDDLLSKSLNKAKLVAAQPGLSYGNCDVYEDSLALTNNLQTLKNNSQHLQEHCKKLLLAVPEKSSNSADWKHYLKQIDLYLLKDIARDYASLKMQQSVTIFYKPVLEYYTKQKVLTEDKEVAEECTNMLTTIKQRKYEVDSRVRIWQIYSEYKRTYLQWIQSCEAENPILEQRYIHMKRLPQLQLSVNSLSLKLIEGEQLLQQLQKHQQAELLPMCDEQQAKEVQAEQQLLQQRLEKLKLAVQTQQDSLRFITELSANYELIVVSIQTTFFDIESLLQKASMATDMQEYMKLCERERQKLLSIKAQEIKQLQSIESQLQPHLSEYDLKAMRQQIWVLEQHLHDLDYQLNTLINKSEERMGSLQKLNKSMEELSWKLQKLETEIIEGTIENDQVNDELLLHEKQCEWLKKSVENLPESLKEKMYDLNVQYAHVQQLSRQRADRTLELKNTLLRLEERSEALNVWLYEIELELNKPLSFESFEDSALRKKLKHNEQIQRKIEQQSSNVGEVLNLMELLLTDTKSTSVLEKAKYLESRWKQVCSGSSARKQRIVSIWHILQELHGFEEHYESWLLEQYEELTDLERNVDNLPEDVASKRLKFIKSKLPELQNKQVELLKLEQLYRDFTVRQDVNVEKMSELLSPLKEMIAKWSVLLTRYQLLMVKLDSSEKYRQELLQAQSVIMTLLISIQTEISNLDITVADKALKRINSFKQFKLKEAAAKIQSADELLRNVEAKDFAPEYYSEIRVGKTQYDKLWREVQSQLLEVETKLRTEIKTHTEITAKETYKIELINAIEVCKQHFEELRKAICDKTCLPGPQRINKLLTNAKTSTETIRHLSRKLIEEHAATNTEAQVESVAELILQFETLESQWKTRKQQEQSQSKFGRITCPLCTNKDWQQIDHDMWRLEQWLEYAENTQKEQITAPTHIEHLEDAALDHREFLLDLESHQSIVSSLNIIGDHLANHSTDTEKARSLRQRLYQDNARWNVVCINSNKWQGLLQTALMSNNDFHKILEELCTWLQATELKINSSEPINLSEEHAVLQIKLHQYRDLHAELKRCEPRVVSLQDVATQLLRGSISEPDGEASAVYEK